MRVLLICDTYPPVLGGSEIEAQRIAIAMIRSGHPVRVLCSGGPPMPPVREWVDVAGVPVSILTRRSRGRAKDVTFALRVAWAISRGKRKYDIVYFLMQGLHVATGLPAAHAIGIPTVMKISGDGIISLMRGSRAGRLELGWLQKWSVPLMLLNDAMIREAMDSGFPRGQLTWMPNPVEINEFRPAEGGEAAAWRVQHNIPMDALVVIYVGRLSPEKGLTGLLCGFALAAREEPRAVLALVGDGPQRAELEHMALSAVRFVGRVDVAQVPFWLRASDVFALTSPNEGFPCSLLEAMAVELPSVVSAIPANLQLVDEGVHGFTVPFDDENAIASALLRLFGDADLRTRMGKAARERVAANYSTAQVVARYEKLFAETIATHKDERGRC